MIFTKIAIDKMADISDFDEMLGGDVSLPKGYSDIQRHVDTFADKHLKDPFERFQGKVNDLDAATDRGIAAGKAYAQDLIESGKANLGSMYDSGKEELNRLLASTKSNIMAGREELGNLIDSGKDSLNRAGQSIKEGLGKLLAINKDSIAQGADSLNRQIQRFLGTDSHGKMNSFLHSGNPADARDALLKLVSENPGAAAATAAGGAGLGGAGLISSIRSKRKAAKAAKAAKGSKSILGKL